MRIRLFMHAWVQLHLLSLTNANPQPKRATVSPEKRWTNARDVTAFAMQSGATSRKAFDQSLRSSFGLRRVPDLTAKRHHRNDSGLQSTSKLRHESTKTTSSSLSMVSLDLDGSSSSSDTTNNNNAPSSSSETATTTKKNLQSLARYLEIECWKRREVRELEPVLTAVGNACKQINRIVQRAQTDDLYGPAVAAADSEDDTITNVQGEIQQKLDVVCNTIMLRAFCGCGASIVAVASEEEDMCRSCQDVMSYDDFGDAASSSSSLSSSSMSTTVGKQSRYVAVFDPIDGSKNIDSSLPVGTIFGIYRVQPGMMPAAVNDGGSNKGMDPERLLSFFLQRGAQDHLVAAGYCLYSATTVLVLTLGSGVDGFTLDPDYGNFLHTHRDMRVPPSGHIYSMNEANVHTFEEPVRQYLRELKKSGGASGLRHAATARVSPTARYVGALVADVHNILINGGIYGYPATLSNPRGKLRLLYECCPMAMIMEQAGGAASTGRGRVLNVLPKEIHQRSPLFLGSVENVFEMDQFHRYYGDESALDDDEVEQDDYYIQHNV